MTVGEAKDVARRWVVDEAGGLPGFVGAYHVGSTHWLPEHAELPAYSDVDVTVVLSGDRMPPNPGKLARGGVLIDGSYLPADALDSAEAVLNDYHLAGAFRVPGIITDPTGRLAALHAAVAPEFARSHWVRRRCEHARQRVLRNLASFDEAQTPHAQVLAWAFAAGVTAHVLLVAGLRNPTVRRRYVAVRELLADCGRLDFYATLLEPLGCADLGADRVRHHIDWLAGAFDAAAAALRTPVVFAGDLRPAARLIAIDGGRDLVDRGLHREAVFWLVVTAARCREVLCADATPDVRDRYEPGFRALLADLGASTSGDLRRRIDQTRALLPRVAEVAETLINANAAVCP